MAYGVTVNGFEKKTFDIILEEKKQLAKAYFGVDVDLTDTSPLLKFLQTTTLEEVNLWDLAETIYYSGFVESSEGTSLDRVVRLLGIYRNAANNASGHVTFNGSDGTAIPTGTTVRTSTGVRFVVMEDGTIASGSVILAVMALNPGTSGNVTSNSITLMENSIIGVTSLANADPTSGGTDIETDASLRVRALGALERSGNATLESIRQAVLAVDGVTAVSVIENTTLHSINVVVKGPTYPDDEVYNAIDGARAAGIAFTWQNPTGVDIYIDCTVDVNVNTYPSDAVTQIEDALLAYVNDTLEIGDDVIFTKLYEVIFDIGDWVLDVTLLTLDTSSPPVGTSNIVISATQEAQTDATKIDPTINPISPP